jgi:hypothetical protein
MLFEVVDELLARAARGESAPERLDAPAMGKFEADDAPDDTLDG